MESQRTTPLSANINISEGGERVFFFIPLFFALSVSLSLSMFLSIFKFHAWLGICAG